MNAWTGAGSIFALFGNYYRHAWIEEPQADTLAILRDWVTVLSVAEQPHMPYANCLPGPALQGSKQKPTQSEREKSASLTERGTPA